VKESIYLGREMINPEREWAKKTEPGSLTEARDNRE
jgi:hypothetical protein